MRKEEGISALKIGLLTIEIILLLECPSATSLKQAPAGGRREADGGGCGEDAGGISVNIL